MSKLGRRLLLFIPRLLKDTMTNVCTTILQVGVFLPWHRLAIQNYEETLRHECNYTGAQPYWDYTLDTPERNGSWLTSPVLDSITGFGGDGNKTLKNCVLDGPFAKYKVFLGPGNSYKSNSRCLTRRMNAGAAETAASAKNLAALMGKTSYESFYALSSGSMMTMEMHSVGHLGLGGEMSNLWSSTNDPLFFMHHAELDRLWAKWQGDNTTRLNDLAAPVSFSFASLFFGRKTAKTSAQTMVWMGRFPPDTRIGAIADTQNRDGKGVLCYKYDD